MSIHFVSREAATATGIVRLLPPLHGSLRCDPVGSAGSRPQLCAAAATAAETAQLQNSRFEAVIFSVGCDKRSEGQRGVPARAITEVCRCLRGSQISARARRSARLSHPTVKKNTASKRERGRKSIDVRPRSRFGLREELLLARLHRPGGRRPGGPPRPGPPRPGPPGSVTGSAVFH